MGAAFFGQVGERALRLSQFLEFAMERTQKLVVETGPDFCRKQQLILLIIAYEDRPKILPRALRLGVTADHKFLLIRPLEFYPRAAPLTDLVARIAFLCEQTLQPARFHLTNQLLRVGLNAAGEANRLARVRQ